MTRSAAFTADEWKRVLQAPTSAGILVMAAEWGGFVRESMSAIESIARVFEEAVSDEAVSTR